MKLLIVYDCDNGYSCNCCGQHWTEVDTFDLGGETDVEEFVNKHREEVAKDYTNERYGRYAIAGAYTIDKTIVSYK